MGNSTVNYVTVSAVHSFFRSKLLIRFQQTFLKLFIPEKKKIWFSGSVGARSRTKISRFNTRRFVKL